MDIKIVTVFSKDKKGKAFYLGKLKLSGQVTLTYSIYQKNKFRSNFYNNGNNFKTEVIIMISGFTCSCVSMCMCYRRVMFSTPRCYC